MKKVKIIMLGLSVILALANCKKDDPDDNDPDTTETKQMNVDINNPTTDQMFGLNDVVTISGLITANFDMHGYEVKLFNESNSDSIMFESFTHGHGESMNFSETWTNTVSDSSDVRVEVSALGDHEGSLKGTDIVHIHCHPM